MSSISVPSSIAEITVLDTWPLAELAVKGVVIPRFAALLELSGQSAAHLLISEMNLGELFDVVAKQAGEQRAGVVVDAVRQLPIHIIPVSSGAVLDAARLKARHSISYADAFCAALAIANSAAVLTGDRDFLSLQSAGILRVDWVGR